MQFAGYPVNAASISGIWYKYLRMGVALIFLIIHLF